MSFVYAEEIANVEAYEGRANLGNSQPGDGKRFKARGLSRRRRVRFWRPRT